MAFTTFLVDDDPGVLKALARMLRASGYEARSYSSSEEFLSAHDDTIAGCAIVDLTMPVLDGFDLQQRLAASDVRRPVIFLTGKGDIMTSVQAMKAGAVDFLTKPVKRDALFAAIERARDLDEKTRDARCERQSLQAKVNKLTPREREVLTYVVTGMLNKQIAACLGTVEKTIKVHRGRMMTKLGIHSVADLVRFAERAGITAH